MQEKYIFLKQLFFDCRFHSPIFHIKVDKKTIV